MDNIREINTGKANIALVKIPDGAKAWMNSSYHVNTLWYKDDSMRYPKHIDLPGGEWKPLNLLPDLTEEQYAELVEPEVRILSWPENTDMPEVEDVSCKEVFNDIMIANNCFTVNPLGEKPDETFNAPAWEYVRFKWEKYQENVGSWLVLVREQ